MLGNITQGPKNYNALERALLSWHAIDCHIAQVIHEDPGIPITKDVREGSDRYIVQQIFNFLGSFKKEPLALDGHQLQESLDNIYPSIELLCEHILTIQARAIGKSHQLDLSVQLTREKMHKYYFIDQLSPIICPLILLHSNIDNFLEGMELGWGLRPE